MHDSVWETATSKPLHCLEAHLYPINHATVTKSNIYLNSSIFAINKSVWINLYKKHFFQHHWDLDMKWRSFKWVWTGQIQHRLLLSKDSKSKTHDKLATHFGQWRGNIDFLLSFVGFIRFHIIPNLWSQNSYKQSKQNHISHFNHIFSHFNHMLFLSPSKCSHR